MFLSSVFEAIDMTPLPGFVDKFMPKQFAEAGYCDTAVSGDASEVWISQSENYDLKISHSLVMHQSFKTPATPHSGLSGAFTFYASERE